MEHPRVRDARSLAPGSGSPDGDARSPGPAARAPSTRYIHAYNFTCTRYYKTVETRARKTESPRCSGSTSSAAAPERTLTRTRAHTNTCTIQLYLRRWLYVRSPQRLSPHVEHVLHIVHPCTMVDSQPAMSNTSALCRYISPTPNSTRRHSAPDARRHERWGVRAGRQLRLAPLP